MLDTGVLLAFVEVSQKGRERNEKCVLSLLGSETSLQMFNGKQTGFKNYSFSLVYEMTPCPLSQNSHIAIRQSTRRTWYVTSQPAVIASQFLCLLYT
jgi:hypothetical protein